MEETAERAKSFEYLLKFVERKQKELEKKIQAEIRLRFAQIRSELKSMKDDLDRKMMEFKLWAQKEIEKIDDKVVENINK